MAALGSLGGLRVWTYGPEICVGDLCAVRVGSFYLRRRRQAPVREEDEVARRHAAGDIARRGRPRLAVHAPPDHRQAGRASARPGVHLPPPTSRLPTHPTPSVATARAPRAPSTSSTATPCRRRRKSTHGHRNSRGWSIATTALTRSPSGAAQPVSTTAPTQHRPQ